jgi:hypothetical protein
MTAIKKIAAPASSKLAVTVVPAFTGKGAMKRAAAFGTIAGLSFSEDKSRSATIAAARTALGNNPSQLEVDAVKVQYMIGRVASRLPLNARGKARTDLELLAFAEDLIVRYAMPLDPAVKSPKKLHTSKIGYRTAEQHKVVRAANESCSQFLAELGLNKAKTQAEKNASKKTANAPSMAGSGKGKGKAVPPAHAELVTPRPMTPADYVQHMQTQLSALLAFDNKYAKLRPTTHGVFAEQLAALKQTANAAANDFALREAAAKK